MVLENILISRSFTWEQMVELLENRICQLENIKMIIIAGITTLWPNYKQQTFEGMLQAISGIKKLIFKSNPLIILTGSLNKYSEFKLKGGKYLAHFGSVLVLIINKERYIKYRLIQHPSMPEKCLIKRKPLKPKRGLTKPLKTLISCSVFPFKRGLKRYIGLSKPMFKRQVMKYPPPESFSLAPIIPILLGLNNFSKSIMNFLFLNNLFFV